MVCAPVRRDNPRALAITTYQLIFIQPFLDWNPVPETYANSANSVQQTQNAASDQGLRCLLTGISTI